MISLNLRTVKGRTINARGKNCKGYSLSDLYKTCSYGEERR